MSNTSNLKIPSTTPLKTPPNQLVLLGWLLHSYTTEYCLEFHLHDCSSFYGQILATVTFPVKLEISTGSFPRVRIQYLTHVCLHI